MLYLAKSGFWLTGAKVMSTLASLISSVAFANLLPEETYGMFRYVLSIATLLAIPTLHGIETALTRSIAKGNYADTDLALKTRLKWGVLGGFASLVLAGYYYFAGNNTLCLSFLIVAVFVPFMDSFHLYASVLNGKKKFNALAKDEVFTRMSVAILLAGIIFFTQNILTVLFTFFFTTTLLRFFFLQHTLRSEEKNNASDPEMIRYGKHLTVIGMFGKVAIQLDKILVFQFVGGAALAAFYLAFTPLKITQNILNSLTTLAFPKFSNTSIENLRKTLPPKVLRLYFIVVPITVVYFFTAPIFFNLLFPLYAEAIFLSQLLFLQLLLFPLTLFRTAVTASEKKKSLYIDSSAYAIVRIGLLIVLVPAYGVMGAIISILINSVVNNLLLVYLFYKK
jgi:O-antigen/teichoic acid export membrane protein